MSDMSVLSIFISLMMAVAQFQQPSFIDIFKQKAIAESISVDYEFSAEFSGMNAKGKGTVEIQGTAYHMTGNGIEIYCDGASTWFIDQVAEEVVIESADSKDAGFLANPIMLLMNLEESTASYKIDGDKIILNMPDSTKLEITLKNISSIPIKKPEAFRPPAEFPKNWIITDLR